MGKPPNPRCKKVCKAEPCIDRCATPAFCPAIFPRKPSQPTHSNLPGIPAHAWFQFKLIPPPDFDGVSICFRNHFRSFLRWGGVGGALGGGTAPRHYRNRKASARLLKAGTLCNQRGAAQCSPESSCAGSHKILAARSSGRAGLLPRQGWLACWLACWLAGWLAGWLARGRRVGHDL